MENGNLAGSLPGSPEPEGDADGAGDEDGAAADYQWSGTNPAGGCGVVMPPGLTPRPSLLRPTGNNQKFAGMSGNNQKLAGIAALAARAQAGAGWPRPRGVTPAGLGLRPRLQGNAGESSGPGRGGPSKMQLVVSNLNMQTQEPAIMAFFKQARIPVARLQLPKEDNGQPKGYALVDIVIPGQEDQEVAADFAVHRLNGQNLGGAIVQVEANGPVQVPVLPRMPQQQGEDATPATPSGPIGAQRPWNPLAALSRLKEQAMANRAAAASQQGGQVGGKGYGKGGQTGEEEAPRWKTQLCSYFKEGRCTRGDQCQFAHGEAELAQNQAPAQSQAPALTPAERLRKIAEMRGLTRPAAAPGKGGPIGARTVAPPTWGGQQGSEPQVDQHGQPVRKTQICNFWKEGRCTRGDCGFAHGEHELTPPEDAWDRPRSMVQEMRERLAAARGKGLEGKGKGKDYGKDAYGKDSYGKGGWGNEDAYGGYGSYGGYGKDYGKGYEEDDYSMGKGTPAHAFAGKWGGKWGGKGEGKWDGKWGGKSRPKPRPDRKGRAPLNFVMEDSLGPAERLKAQVVEANRKDLGWNAHSKASQEADEEDVEEDKPAAFLLNEDGVPYLFETYGLGAQLLVGMGWSPGAGVGKTLAGRIEPISVQIMLEPTTHFGRRDRRCLGVAAPAEFQDSERSDESADPPARERSRDKDGKRPHGGRGDRKRSGSRGRRSRSRRRKDSRSKSNHARRRKLRPKRRSEKRGRSRSRSRGRRSKSKDRKGKDERRDDKNDDKKADEKKDDKANDKKGRAKSRSRSSRSSSSSSSSSSRSRGKRRRTSAAKAPKAAAGAAPAAAAAAAPAAGEAAVIRDPPEIAKTKTQVLAKLTVLKNVEPKEQRMKEFRQMLREWHPDKNPERIEMATAVFQFLQKGKSLLNLK